ncbi:MAG: glucokinase, partial [Pseudomonadota bacterium]|nr:glucokinase [Pseudomonadota bacterium]
MILAGDIGGTSTRLAQFNVVDGNLNRLSMEVYSSRDHSNLSEILRIYCKQHPADIALACLGIAAPVDKGVARTPNLPWHVSEAELQRDSGLSQVRLINDLEANAWGIGGLGEDDFCVLNEVHEKVSGNQAVISAGTGLGEAGLYWDGYSYHPFACEGGHADFAPCNELQVELLAYLNRINGG